MDDKVRTTVALDLEIDAQFAQMALDPDYQEEAQNLAEECATADWEALGEALGEALKDHPSTRTSSR